MINKKVIGKLYDANGTSNPNDDFLVGTYDCWNMHESGQKVYLTVREGPSHRWVTSFNNNNIADFNNDTYVDFEDWSILANEYKTGVSNPGNYLSDISGPEDKSDGYVDWYDAKVFCDNWLDGR